MRVLLFCVLICYHDAAFLASIFSENHRFHIRQIKIRGNQKVASKELLSSLFSLEGINYFSQPHLDSYKKNLLAEYHRRGFLDAEILAAQVEVYPDFNAVNLIFQLKEGEKYELDEINLSGDIPIFHDSSSWRSHFSLQKGDVFNLLLLQEEADELLSQYREDGYLLAELKPKVRITRQAEFKKAGAVSVTYDIDKGSLIYVRQFLIEGNVFSKENVIRREIPVIGFRACRFSDLHLLQQKLMALGFLSRVQVLLVKTDILNQVDVLIRVVENPAWFFSVFPMFISDEGLVFSGIFAHRNWLGRGLYSSLSLRLSSFLNLFDFVFIEPRLFDSRQSFIFEIHRRELRYSTFHSKKIGASIGYTVPIGNYFKFSPAMHFDLVDIDGLKNEKLVEQEAFVAKNNWRNAWEVVFAFDYEKSIWKIHCEASGTYSGFLNFSQMPFAEAGTLFQISARIFKNFKIKWRFQSAKLFSLQQTMLPLSERYFLGGQGSVRGYRPRSIGPELGGVFKYLQSVEFEFPVWPKYAFTGYGFIDAGNAFLLDNFEKKARLYWSLGAGLILKIWQFPLRLELSAPLENQVSGIPFDVFFGAGSDW
jgi:outer membrane protein insertion porin family